MKRCSIAVIALFFLFSSLSFAAPAADREKVPAKSFLMLCASDTVSVPGRTDREKDSQKPLPPVPKPDSGKDSGSRDKSKPAPKHPTDTP